MLRSAPQNSGFGKNEKIFNSYSHRPRQYQSTYYYVIRFGVDLRLTGNNNGIKTTNFKSLDNHRFFYNYLYYI